MMLWTRRAVVALALAFLVVGCASFKKTDENKVEPLPKIQQTVSFKTDWKAKGGAGSGNLLFNLAPALTSYEGEPILVTADYKGYVAARDAKTGNQLWRVDTNLPLSSAVGYTDDLIVVGSHKGDVVALNKANGSESWRIKTSTEVLAGPMGKSSGLAVLTIDSRLHGLDPATGNEKWIFDAIAPALKLRGGSTPLIIDQVALVGFASGQAGLFDLNSGRVIWLEAITQPRGRTEIERVVDLNGRLVRRGQQAYLVTYQGKVVGLDLQQLRVMWSRDSSSYVGLDAGHQAVVVTDSEGRLHAFDRISGDSLWVQDALMNRQPTAPLIVNNHVIVGDIDGRIYALSLTQETSNTMKKWKVQDFWFPLSPTIRT